LKVVPGKGTFISENGSISNREISTFDRTMEAVSLAELMKAREVIECGAARLAAEHADPENLERLSGAVSRLNADCKDIETYYQNDFAFHLAVAEASNNPVIFEIVKMLVERSHQHIGFMNDLLGIAMPVKVERCVNTAREVFAYIKEGNAPKSDEAMRAHLNIVNYELKQALFGES
jgi:GntR family transcriptional repressor for pyruvate dehydrogenase complex